MENDILKGATSTIFAQNNDAYGQGNRAGCLELSLSGRLTRSQRTGLLAGLLFLFGLIIAFCGFYGYNRWASKMLGAAVCGCAEHCVCVLSWTGTVPTRGSYRAPLGPPPQVQATASSIKPDSGGAHGADSVPTRVYRYFQTSLSSCICA